MTTKTINAEVSDLLARLDSIELNLENVEETPIPAPPWLWIALGIALGVPIGIGLLLLLG